MSDINQNIDRNQMNFMQSFSNMQKDIFLKMIESLEVNKEIAAKIQIFRRKYDFYKKNIWINSMKIY